MLLALADESGREKDFAKLLDVSARIVWLAERDGKQIPADLETISTALTALPGVLAIGLWPRLAQELFRAAVVPLAASCTDRQIANAGGASHYESPRVRLIGSVNRTALPE